MSLSFYSERVGRPRASNPNYDPNRAGGTPVGLPNRDFQPISTNPKVQALDPNQFSDPTFYSPFGVGGYGASTRQGDDYFGGKSDLLPSIATRGVGIRALEDIMARDPTMMGRDYGAMLQTGANQMGGGLLSEAQAQAAPGITRDTILEERKMDNSINALLNQFYSQGGNLWGSAVANTGGVNQRRNELNKAKIGAATGWIGGIPFVGGILGGAIEGGSR